MATTSSVRSSNGAQPLSDKKLLSKPSEKSDIKQIDVLDEYHPKATRSLYIRNLDKVIQEKELQEKFHQFGDILDVHITQKQHSTHAIVQFWDIASVSKCLNQRKGICIGSNKIELTYGKSVQTDCIWLGNLADTITDKFLHWQFSKCGGFSHATVDSHRKTALVFFNSKEDARVALSGLNNKVWAEQRIQTDYASQVLIDNFLQDIKKVKQLEAGKQTDGQIEINRRIYLDCNATTPLEDEVLESVHRALRDAWGNPSSSHQAGVMAKTEITRARENVADMIRGKPSDIIFTSGGTEANNVILQSVVQYCMTCFENDQNAGNRHPHIISTTLEHDSVKVVLEHLVSRGKAEVTFVAAHRQNGTVDVEEVVAAVRPSTCLVSVMLANNETGVLQPVQRISELITAMKRGPGETSKIFIHTDAAQALGKIPVNVGDLGVDYLTIVGHKFYGPRIGAIYAKNLEEGDTPLYPMLYGGGQERNYRPGTENTGMIAGLGKAAEMVVSFLPQYSEAMINARDYLEKELEVTFGGDVTINCQGSARLPNTCSAAFKGKNLEGHRILNKTKRLQASVGAACHAQNRPSPILLASGVMENQARNTLRLSVGRYTRKEEIDIVIADLKQAIDSSQSEIPSAKTCHEIVSEEKIGVWKPFQGYQ